MTVVTVADVIEQLQRLPSHSPVLVVYRVSKPTQWDNGLRTAPPVIEFQGPHVEIRH